MGKRPVLGQIVAKAVIVFKNGRLWHRTGCGHTFERIELNRLNAYLISAVGGTRPGLDLAEIGRSDAAPVQLRAEIHLFARMTIEMGK